MLLSGNSVREENHKAGAAVHEPEVEQEAVYEEPPNQHVIYDEPPEVSLCWQSADQYKSDYS